MPKILLILLILTLITAGGCKSLKTPSDSEVLGIKIGMNKTDAEKRLHEIGKLEKEESKQQEVWSLNNDPHYSFLILAYEKESQKVRFVTVKARENGSRVRYTDVLDTGKAQQKTSAANFKYIQEIPGGIFTSGYFKIASGTDSTYLNYFSLKDSDSSEEEDDDDE